MMSSSIRSNQDASIFTLPAFGNLEAGMVKSQVFNCAQKDDQESFETLQADILTSLTTQEI